MFKDQPVFCNCLKILTAEGLPESHFYLQFPSSGFPAIKNLKEPQKEGQLAHTQTVMSNYSASGNHWLFLCSLQMTAGLGGVAATCFPHPQSRIQQSRPSTPPCKAAFPGAALALPAQHHVSHPQVQTDSSGSPGDTKHSSALSKSVLQPQGLLKAFSLISYWVLWQLSTHSGSLCSTLWSAGYEHKHF